MIVRVVRRRAEVFNFLWYVPLAVAYELVKVSQIIFIVF